MNTSSSKFIKFLKIFAIIICKICTFVFIASLFVFALWWLSQKPSLYRDWEPQDAKLPIFSWSGNVVSIENIRNHHWISDKDFTPNYLSGSYNTDDITSVDYIITPFSSFRGPAHTMLSFGFKDGRRLVISAEIRKERGENFSALKGLLNQYEIQYVVATEEDVLKLRTNHRKNSVILYPIKASTEDIAGVFRSMLIRSEKLSKEPEFYNTIFNNCTTSILDHVNAFRNKKIGWSLYTILPAESDEIVYKAWLINTNLSLEEARKFFNISAKAQATQDTENFSTKIRQ